MIGKCELDTNGEVNYIEMVKLSQTDYSKLYLMVTSNIDIALGASVQIETISIIGSGFSGLK